MRHVRSAVLALRCVLRLGMAIAFVFLAATGVARSDESKTPRTDLYGDPLPPGALMRLGTIRLRHDGGDVAFSTDGKRIISCGYYGDIRVWDVATGALLRRSWLDGKPDALGLRFREVALSSDGAAVAVWDHRTLFLFDTATGKLSKRLSTMTNSPYPRLRISPDGKMVAVQTFDDSKICTLFRLWDTVGGGTHLLALDPSLNGLHDLTFTPNGKYLAGIGSPGFQLFLWEALTGKVIRRPSDGDAVQGRAVAFSPDSKTLALSSNLDASVRLYDVDAWKEKGVIQFPDNVKKSSIQELAFSPDGQYLAGRYGDFIGDPPSEHGVLLWDLAAPNKARRFPQCSNCRLRFAPDSKTLACYGGGAISLWDVATGREKLHWFGHNSAVRTITVSSDGRTIASSAEAWRLRLWNAETGKPLAELGPAGHSINTCIFSPDGKRIVTVSDCTRKGYIFQTWDLAGRKELLRFFIPRSAPINALGMSADGTRLWATVADKDVEKEYVTMRLRIWNTDTGKRLTQRSYRIEVRTIPFGPSGELGVVKEYRDHTVFAPNGSTMSVWQGIEDISSGCLLASMPKGLDHPMVFSADSRLLLAAIIEPNDSSLNGEDCKGLALFEAASGEQLFHWNMGEVNYVAFTTDARGVIAADKEELRVWDAVTGSKLFQMHWPECIRDARGIAKISSLAPLPGGRVATGMAEGEILIWDLASSRWPVRKTIADLGQKELETLWSDLAGDAQKAQRAIASLAISPAKVIPFLHERLRPAAEVDRKRLEQWLVDLDSDTFTKREAASHELAGLCDRVEARLRRALHDRPSLEMRRRLEYILEGPRRPSAERLRTLRAIAVLEHIGTPEARRILEKLAGGAASPETRAAEAALQRLKYR